MKKFKKAIAVSAVIALVLFVAFLPVFAALIEGGHNCCGEECLICRAISVINSGGLKLLGLSGAICFVAILSCLRLSLPGAFVFGAAPGTPVSLKTKLLN